MSALATGSRPMDNVRLVPEVGALRSPRRSSQGSPRRRQVRLQLRTAGRACYEYAALYSSLLLLAAICLTWSALMLPLHALLPAGSARRVVRYSIMTGCRIYVRWLALIRAYQLDLTALDALPTESPLIIAPNHPSLIDALLILAGHPNLTCVMKSDLRSNILLGPGTRAAGFIRSDSAWQMVQAAVADLACGNMLLLFPEGTRTLAGPINTLTKSVAVIAWRTQAPVQTLIIESDSRFLSKGWPLLARPALPVRYRVRLGRRFDAPADAEQLVTFTRTLEQHYRAELSARPAAPPPAPRPAAARH
jgi:1-acyl-sn-glycerol-3-phosphate acyltransferase